MAVPKFARYDGGTREPGMNPNVTGDLFRSFDGFYVVLVYNYYPKIPI